MPDIASDGWSIGVLIRGVGMLSCRGGSVGLRLSSDLTDGLNELARSEDLSGNPSFGQSIQRVKETALEAYAHQGLLFAEQAAKMPDAIALLYEDSELTDGELDRRSNRLAHHLRGLGIRNRPIWESQIDSSQNHPAFRKLRRCAVRNILAAWILR
jgi:hypothetical protein